MADFIYYPEAYTGTNKCCRIHRPSDTKVYCTDGDNADTMVTAASIPGTNTLVQTTEALPFIAGVIGYPIDIATLFPSLPQGEYDLMIYDCLYSAITAQAPERGWVFKWTGKAMLEAPKEKLADRVI